MLSLFHLSNFGSLDIAKAAEPKQKSEPKKRSGLTKFNRDDHKPKTKKKVVILYAQLGKGHISASRATAEALKKLYSDKIDVEILDFFQTLNRGINQTFKKVYDGSVKFIPNFYKAFFDLTDKRWPIKFLNQINYPLLSSAMKKIIQQNDPDILISTFPMWDYLTAHMLKKRKSGAKFINIITDSISIHQAWLIADADYRIVPNEDTAKVLMKNGVDHEKIKTLGFPVQLAFNEETNKQKILKSLGLNPKLFTILLFATVGNNRHNVKMFEKIIYENRDYNVICVTGRNNTVMSKIKHLDKENNVKILGWADNVPDLMKSSDIIITKAGGATTMECMAAKKPMIISQVIPGQEEGNAKFIKIHNLGVILEKGRKGVESIPSVISKMRKDYDKYIKALEKEGKPQAAFDIAHLIAQELGIEKAPNSKS